MERVDSDLIRCGNNRGKTLSKKLEEFPQRERKAEKDGRDDAADAHLIARHNGQHPWLFIRRRVGFPPRLRGVFVSPAGCAPTRASVIRSASC